MNSEARKRDQERRAAEAAAAPCRTCMGPVRETVGMVCQTCGKDYAASPEIIAARDMFAVAWADADARGWAGHRVEAGLRALVNAGWTPPGALAEERAAATALRSRVEVLGARVYADVIDLLKAIEATP